MGNLPCVELIAEETLDVTQQKDIFMHRITSVLNRINSQKARKILLHSNLISQFEQICQGGSLIVRAYFPDGTNFAYSATVH